LDDGLRHQLDEDMARLADGDRAVFSRVFRTLWPVVRAFCARGVSERDADDAAQVVMEKVFEQASRYERSRPALPWVLAIAAWECRTIRKRHVRRREDPIDTLPDAASDDSPEEVVLIQQLHIMADAVLGQLSVADREAIASAYADRAGLHLDVTGATLRKRRERALGRLRAAWRKLNGD
jgi:RNA polymerase sigma-70 factor, ECF subfamily